ncbi:MAG: hypothetical protein IJU64_06190 [Bacilli bacterium]|nr:hypothetical protein [Bacilli bacterium]
MEITVLSPYGFCMGVHRAIEMARKALREEGPLTMLGSLVHNEEVLTELSQEGMEVREKENPLDLILSIPEKSHVLFSAHGHPIAYEDICNLRKIRYFDATCPYVQENLEAGLTYEGSILYIGIDGHDESTAFLANVPEAVFYDVKTKHWNPLKLKGRDLPVGIICQTTLGNDQIKEAVADIHTFFPEATLLKGNCPSSKLRQENIEKLRDVDALLILGSQDSANSKQLVRIGESRGIESFLCLGLAEVQKLDLSLKKKIALGSGASVSEGVFQSVLTYLRSL